MPDSAETHPALDSAQLTRIEATHRGFGYQHFYAVACLLAMDSTATDTVVIEHDEDIELVRGAATVYVQVKTRERPLRLSDLHGVLPRFDLLRQEHIAGRRPGDVHFAIVSNTQPGPDLLARLAETTWPPDVAVLWPGGCPLQVELQLPEPWADLGKAMQSCVGQAALVPFPSLAPETLVLKLAGLVQYLATGHAGHTVTRAQIHEFLEQLVVQLHDFPQPPADYRRQVDEPALLAADKLRLVIGLSGTGKTAWASNAALQDPSPTAYFDVGELPSQALASSLARELVARFLTERRSGTDGAGLPTASGLELLALLSRQFRESRLTVTVVLDNVHRVSAAALRSLVEAAPDVRFVLLGQPWPGQAEVEALMGVQAVTLGGWSLDDLAAVFAAAGCPLDVSAGQRVLGLTAGAPLYVNAAARLAAQAYATDVNAFLHAVEQRLAHVQTAQEALLAEAFGQLTSDARSAASLLDLSDVPLNSSEVIELLGTANMSGAAAAMSVRELTRAGVGQLIGDGAIKLHDAFRLLARDGRAVLSPAVVEAARETLLMLLQRSLPTGWTVGRFGLWVRLLPQTGRQSTLIDVATQEDFHQIGDPSEIRAILEEVAQSPDLSNQDRFWALDALAFWDYNNGRYGQVPSRVGQMTDITRTDLGVREAAALAMKQMIAAALRGDHTGVESAYHVGMGRVQGSTSLQRIVRYNHALALFQLGKDAETASEALQLVIDYYDHLGLDPADVFGTSPEQIRAAVPDTPDRDDDLRHTGDSLQLVGAAHRRLGDSAAMAFVHATKFLAAASAWRSTVRVGQDAVDELVELGDLAGARNFSEGLLLPIVTGYQLSDLLIPVRGQYAVILAWCGEVDAAREEITKLEAYQLTDTGTAELANQRELIEQIATGNVPPGISKTEG